MPDQPAPDFEEARRFVDGSPVDVVALKGSVRALLSEREAREELIGRVRDLLSLSDMSRNDHEAGLLPESTLAAIQDLLLHDEMLREAAAGELDLPATESAQAEEQG